MSESTIELQAAQAPTSLTVERLYRCCNAEDLPFSSTEELEPLGDHLGQDRAVEALQFGLQIPHEGFNIFLLGSTGVGKRDLRGQLELHRRTVDRRVRVEFCRSRFMFPIVSSRTNPLEHRPP